jgi:hypothetical protein
MRSTFAGIIITALALHWPPTCLAQSSVDSSMSSGSGPLTGSRVAAVNYSPIWQIGSPPFSLRILGGDYWTDSTGRTIPWAARARQSGDKHHRFTRLLLGRVSISLPVSPAAAGFLCVSVVFLLGFLLFDWVNRRRETEHEEQVKP